MMDIYISGDTIKLTPMKKEDLSMINLWYHQIDSYGYATAGKNPEEVLAGLNNENTGFVLGIYPAGTESCIGLIAGEIKSIREPVLWVRTFLIDAHWQRMHYGSTAFQLLSEYITRNLHIKRFFVSVAIKNRVGAAFWKSLGFRCIKLFFGSSGHSSSAYIFEKVIQLQ